MEDESGKSPRPPTTPSRPTTSRSLASRLTAESPFSEPSSVRHTQRAASEEKLSVEINGVPVDLDSTPHRSLQETGLREMEEQRLRSTSGRTSSSHRKRAASSLYRQALTNQAMQHQSPLNVSRHSSRQGSRNNSLNEADASVASRDTSRRRLFSIAPTVSPKMPSCHLIAPLRICTRQEVVVMSVTGQVMVFYETLIVPNSCTPEEHKRQVGMLIKANPIIKNHKAQQDVSEKNEDTEITVYVGENAILLQSSSIIYRGRDRNTFKTNESRTYKYVARGTLNNATNTSRTIGHLAVITENECVKGEKTLEKAEKIIICFDQPCREFDMGQSLVVIPEHKTDADRNVHFDEQVRVANNAIELSRRTTIRNDEMLWEGERGEHKEGRSYVPNNNDANGIYSPTEIRRQQEQLIRQPTMSPQADVSTARERVEQNVLATQNHTNPSPPVPQAEVGTGRQNSPVIPDHTYVTNSVDVEPESRRSVTDMNALREARAHSTPKHKSTREADQQSDALDTSGEFASLVERLTVPSLTNISPIRPVRRQHKMEQRSGSERGQTTDSDIPDLFRSSKSNHSLHSQREESVEYHTQHTQPSLTLLNQNISSHHEEEQPARNIAVVTPSPRAQRLPNDRACHSEPINSRFSSHKERKDRKSSAGASGARHPIHLSPKELRATSNRAVEPPSDEQHSGPIEMLPNDENVDAYPPGTVMTKRLRMESLINGELWNFNVKIHLKANRADLIRFEPRKIALDDATLWEETQNWNEPSKREDTEPKTIGRYEKDKPDDATVQDKDNISTAKEH